MCPRGYYLRLYTQKMQVVRYSSPWGHSYEIVDTPVMLGGYISTNMPYWVRRYLHAVDVYLAHVFLGAPEGMTISEYAARLMSQHSGRPIGESMRRFHALLAWRIGYAVQAAAPSIPAHVVASELFDVFEDIR